MIPLAKCFCKNENPDGQRFRSPRQERRPIFRKRVRHKRTGSTDPSDGFGSGNDGWQKHLET